MGVYQYHENNDIVLRMETSLPSEWYNNMTPTDTLNPDAVRAFLCLTHEKYKETIGKEFGGTVQGFFTDEPNCFDFFTHFDAPKPWVPWTHGFSEYFEQNRGYDPTPYLPHLFLDDFQPGNPDISKEKLRHDFWRTVTQRFSHAYMKQLYDWCGSNHLLSAGHLLYEKRPGVPGAGVRSRDAALPLPACARHRYSRANRSAKP